MSTIPFIDARFFDPNETRFELEARLTRHLCLLRRKRLPPGVMTPPDDVLDDIDSINENPKKIVGISTNDDVRIRRRVKRLLELRTNASGLEHLKSDDRDRLEVLRGGARLVSIASEHRADELADALHRDMQWMGSATEIVWHAMRRSVREGWPGLRVPPLLLTGPPGIGKSHWARRISQLLSTTTGIIEASTENASFGLVGSQRGWGGNYPGRLVETVLKSRIANPVMIVDEVEKAGTAVSVKGHAFGLAEALLPLLEPMTAQHWTCPYYQVRFDMSWVIWVLTANNHRQLPEPLLSRCPAIHLRNLTPAELQTFVRREGAKRSLSELSIDVICEVLAHPSLKRYQPSLRATIRMLQLAADLEHRPILH